MAARNFIDSPRRLAMLLALCAFVTFPRSFALSVSEDEEVTDEQCVYRIPDDDKMGFHEFAGIHIRKTQHYEVGIGEDYCRKTMGGIGGVESTDYPGTYFCKCDTDKYFAFFGMCMPMPWNNRVEQSKMVDGVLIGREAAYARLLPPATDNGSGFLDDYSFFQPLLGDTASLKKLYVAHAICDLAEEFEHVMYDGSTTDYVCVCKGELLMNKRGECVKKEDCDQQEAPGWYSEKYGYCFDDI